MTEDQAKTKWCPYSRHHPSQDSAKCIGSECMAWRTEQRFGDFGQAFNFGYCGLAGRP